MEVAGTEAVGMEEDTEVAKVVVVMVEVVKVMVEVVKVVVVSVEVVKVMVVTVEVVKVVAVPEDMMVEMVVEAVVDKEPYSVDTVEGTVVGD